MPDSRNRLDVEDDDARQLRIGSLLERTDAARAATLPRPVPTLPPSRPHPIPLSDLISRAEAFLPRLAASNDDLARRAALDPSSVDIEHLGDNPQHIEMNLGLGVFEQRPRPGSQNRDHKHDSPSRSDSEDSHSEDSHSEDSDTSEDSSENSTSTPTPVLGSDTTTNGS